MWLIPHFKLVHAFVLCKGTVVSVKPAGWDNTVSRKRMSARPARAKMVAPVWTDITATPVSANLDSEVIIIITTFVVVIFQHSISKKAILRNQYKGRHLVLKRSI